MSSAEGIAIVAHILDQHLQLPRVYMVGDTATLADIAVFSALFASGRSGDTTGSSTPSAMSTPNLHRWMAHCATLTAFQRAKVLLENARQEDPHAPIAAGGNAKNQVHRGPYPAHPGRGNKARTPKGGGQSIGNCPPLDDAESGKVR